MDNQKLVGFLSYWLANTAALLLLSVVFKNNVVLGNDKISMPASSVLVGLIITVSSMLLEIFARRVNFVGGVKSTFAGTGLVIKDESVWGIYFFAVNILIVWLIKRIAFLVGFGVSSLLFVAISAVFLTIFQWAAFALTGSSNSSGKNP